MDRKNKKVECEWGIVKKVFIYDKNGEIERVYIIYSPDFNETAYRILNYFVEEEGIPLSKIFMLNTGIAEEAEEAERILSLCTS